MKSGIILAVLGVINVFMYLLSAHNTVHRISYDVEQYTTGRAEIIRDKQTKEAFFRINTEGDWRLFSGNTIASIDMQEPILKGKGSGMFQLNVPKNKRSYFMLFVGDEKILLSEKHLPMEGGYNFRDLGGIKTADGREIKWGRFFRADDLLSLTDSDLEYLSSIPIVSIVDFRSEAEIEPAPDKLPSSVKNYYPLSITPGDVTAENSVLQPDLSSMKGLDLDSLMMDINVRLVTDSASISMYRAFFTLLQDTNRTPLLFHCTAGKDRTGMGTALILYALGVDEETILKDYLLSNQYLKEKYASYSEQYPELASLFGVKQSYLQAGIDRVKKDYGSVENYLKKELSVDIPKFRKIYLY